MRGADKKAKTEKGWTSLHIACVNGHSSVVRLLLDSGADIEVGTTEKGVTPIALACTYNHKKIVRLLADAGAKIDRACHSGSCGCTPAMLAATVGNKDLSEYIDIRHCKVCNKTDNVLKCSRCEKVYYCGKEHQNANWEDHKKVCKSSKV